MVEPEMGVVQSKIIRVEFVRSRLTHYNALLFKQKKLQMSMATKIFKKRGLLRSAIENKIMAFCALSVAYMTPHIKGKNLAVGQSSI